MPSEQRGKLALMIAATKLESLLPITVPFSIDSVEWDARARMVNIYCSGDGLFAHREYEQVFKMNLDTWASEAAQALAELNSSGGVNG